MSDNWLQLIPADPSYIPAPAACEQSRQLLTSFVCTHSEVIARVTDDIRFIDQGANFEAVRCPACDQDLMGWWPTAMDAAYKSQFKSLVATPPCCATPSSLNDLRYQWPAGFARFVLSARNPGISDLQAAQVAAIGDVLGCDLRVVWRHI